MQPSTGVQSTGPDENTPWGHGGAWLLLSWRFVAAAVFGVFIGVASTLVFINRMYVPTAIVFVAVAVGIAVYAVIVQLRERRKTIILREAIDCLPVPMAIYDNKEELHWCNPRYREQNAKAFERLAQRGQRRRPAYLELVAAQFDPDMPLEERTTRIQELLEGRPPEDGRLVERRLQHVGWQRAARRRLPAGGSVHIAIDINELKARETDLTVALDQARASEQVRENFMARITHELRTPLNGIIGMSSVLLALVKDDASQHQAQLIHNSGRHLLDIINRLLDYAKFRSRSSSGEIIDFDLPELVREVVREAAFSPESTEIDLRADIPEELPVMRSGDRQGLRQAVTNLVGNAVKFTRNGEVNVRVREIGETNICIEVEDTGPGIHPSKQETIFEPFRQAEEGATRAYSGTGLGLTITRDLVAEMGGEIHVQSAQGKGSIFTITLPLPRTRVFDLSEPIPRRTPALASKD